MEDEPPERRSVDGLTDDEIRDQFVTLNDILSLPEEDQSRVLEIVSPGMSDTIGQIAARMGNVLKSQLDTVSILKHSAAAVAMPKVTDYSNLRAAYREPIVPTFPVVPSRQLELLGEIVEAVERMASVGAETTRVLIDAEAEQRQRSERAERIERVAAAAGLLTLGFVVAQIAGAKVTGWYLALACLGGAAVLLIAGVGRFPRGRRRAPLAAPSDPGLQV
jgi:hypothetical protein